MKMLAKLLRAMSVKERQPIERLFSRSRALFQSQPFTGLENLEPRMLMSAVDDIVLTEIMYNPVTDNNNHEYLEIKNVSDDTSYNLLGYTFTQGIDYTFPNITLDEGEILILARSSAGFNSYYTDHDADFVLQWTDGGLSNGGEDIILENNSGDIIFEIDYTDEAPWPERPDGNGSSLQIVDPFAPFDPDNNIDDRYDDDNWIASRELEGSPGADGIVDNPIGIVINEILANSNDGIGEVDKIEIYNTTDQPIDLTNIFLTDSTDFELKFRIPNGTMIDPHGFLVFDESQFNVGINGFGISSAGGDQLSIMANRIGEPTLFIDTVMVDATETSVSIGRLPDGDNDLFIPQSEQSFGAPNVAHKQSPVVISEIMYHPESDNDDLEYIELFNQSDSDVNLTNWRLRQDLDFDFPSGTILKAGERLIITRFNPAVVSADRTAFQNEYGILLGTSNNPASNIVQAVGGYEIPDPLDPMNTQSLSNRRAHIALQELTLIGQSDLGQDEFEYIVRDHVSYEDRNDWPGRADGTGASLDREDASLYGNDPDSWRSSWLFGGSPGAEDNRDLTLMINEVMAHTDVPFFDTLELYNSTDSTLDIAGWIITDNFDALFDGDPNGVLFHIPAGVTLPANQYIAYAEDDDFNQNPDPEAIKLPFSLDAARGDELYLIEVDSNGDYVRIADNVEFGATFNGQSVGRWPSGEDNRLFPMKNASSIPYLSSDARGRNTPYTSGANPGPRTDVVSTSGVDVIVSEIMYNPGVDNADDFEYVELYNRRNGQLHLGPVQAGDATFAPEGWRLNGEVDFEFSQNTFIAARGTIVVVGFDPILEPAKLAAFNAHYGTSLVATGSVPDIVGPFEGDDNLDDFEGRIELEKPDFSPGGLFGQDRFTPNVLWDRVQYESTDPWPTSPAGNGDSLSRNELTLFGDFASSWSGTTPSPGSTPNFIPPTITSVAVYNGNWSNEYLDTISTPGAAKGYELSTGPDQLTDAVPFSGINIISIQFSEGITSSSFPSSVSLNGTNGGVYSLNVNYDNTTNTLSLGVLAGLDEDLLSVVINDVLITDLAGNFLDGEWTESVSDYPSGNGIAGGDFIFRFNVLPGDVNTDGTVDAIDLQEWVGKLGLTSADAGYNPALDLNADLVIDSQDRLDFLNNILGLQLGDVNMDGNINAADIDAVGALRGITTADQSYNPLADLNADGVINLTDYDIELIENVLETKPGDATLDKVVNLEDLAKLATFFGGSGGWTEGDFNGDGSVNLEDLARLATNFGYDNSGGAAASEQAPASDNNDDNASSEALYLAAGSNDDADESSWTHIDDILSEI